MSEQIEPRLLASFRQHEAFNAELSRVHLPASEVERRFAIINQHAEEARLDVAVLEPVRRVFLPDLARTATLVARYRRRYLRAGTAVYVLAATSVATGAIDVLFPGMWGASLAWLEVLWIVAILMLLWGPWLRDWHRKWIEYRFLTERLRAAAFLFVAGIPCDPPLPPAYQSASDEWTIGAFRSICAKCSPPSLKPEAIESTKDFLLRAWIGDQRNFYERRSRVLKSRHSWFHTLGWIVFLATLVATVALAFLESAASFGGWFRGFAAASIILPAVGGSIAGVRTYREYQRLSERYESMAQYLKDIATRIQMEGDPRQLRTILVKAGEVMMQEHMDWRAVMIPLTAP
jgi:hypothetical protein